MKTMKTSKFMCITFVVFCLIFSGMFASGTANSDAKQNNKSSQSEGLEFKEPVYGDQISAPLYTPLQRAIKTGILLQGNYSQRNNYIQFYADNYDFVVTNDYCVDPDTAITSPVLSQSLKNANSNIKILDGRATYDIPFIWTWYYNEANKPENESWFIHTADQDGNELALIPDNRLIFSFSKLESPQYCMNPVNTGYQDFMASTSNDILTKHTQLDGIFWDGAESCTREDILYYMIPAEPHTTERGSTGDIVIRLNNTPAKAAYQFVNYVMVKVFNNPNCQGTDLLAANEEGYILGQNKEIHLNPNDPDCPAEGVQVWVKYAANGKLPNYVKNNWITGLTQLFTKVKNSIGTKLSIANSGEALFQKEYYAGVDGLMCEGFIMGVYPYICGPTKGRWENQMADLIDSENRGKHFMANSGIAFSPALTCEILSRFRLFCYASFLLGIDKTAQHESNASFMFIYHDPANEWIYIPQYYPEWDLPIGYALEPYCEDSATGLYVRHFSNGIVLVNPNPPVDCANACDTSDPNRKVYQLNGTYFNYKGQAMTSVTVVPASGAILVQNLGNYVAPNLLEDCKGLPNKNYEGCN